MIDTNGIYSNVGQKIKILAKIVLVFGILLSVSLGIIMFVNSAKASDSYFFGDDMMSFYIILGIIFIFAGSFFSVLFSFIVYAFGAIAEKYLKEKTISDNRRNKDSNNQNNVRIKQDSYNDADHDFKEISSNETPTLIAELNLLLANGEITKDEFQRKHDEICAENITNSVDKRCPNCRTHIREGSNFCTKCGTKIK